MTAILARRLGMTSPVSRAIGSSTWRLGSTERRDSIEGSRWAGRKRQATRCSHTGPGGVGVPSCMRLPVNPPVLPMLANRVGELPPGEGWIFEPKWDGFRTIIFRDGDELLIQSRDAKPLERYFPELVEPLKAQLPERCVLDGELVIALGNALDFEALQLRLHPAASRIKLLARETPASVV